ncbi:unnamed protein product [Hermetia illucens]|uniref:Protein TEX261 n=1 Tax=Hermetia illucens TaxID=343691 RepID=A0A7R8Z1B2_HERIL|nr:protein TEX261 [Hermetia illucens]CAD7089626.1 unnamed protein product [Hermetia illucens]
MSLLFILSYVSIVVHIFFVTVSVAAGLYYLAELVEEYSVTAKRTINWIILGTSAIYVLFIFTDKLPWSVILCGLGAQLFHLLIMKNFPFVEFLSFPFLGTIAMLVANHFLAFQYFTSNYHPFSEVLAYFTLCIWVVPFALFVSLSANDNVLPTVSEQSPLLDNRDVVSNYFSRKGKKQGLLSLFNYAKESLLPQRSKKSF